ncbi:hypothetical protein Tco_1030195 [Tanacetum coccineum]|uniref:Uncharacterized protein n=1 Tax=Tanacetum coccineum TaxID=301880 RepID=A0ABQ5G793_9ASTR
MESVHEHAIRGDVYFLQRDVWRPYVKVMRKLRSRNRLTNLSGDDVATFATNTKDVSPEDQSQKKARTLSTKTLKDSLLVENYKRNRISTWCSTCVIEKMEHIGKEKSSFLDQGHQQAAKGKEEDEEYSNPCIQPKRTGVLPRDIPLDGVEVLRFNTTAGNLVKKILLKLNLSDHKSILTDSKEYLKMVMKVSPILGFPSISLMIISGQSGTLVGKGSACNRGYGHRSPSAYVLRKSFLVLVLLPFHGIPTKMSLDTLFQSQRSLVRMTTLSLLLTRLYLIGMSHNYTLDEDTYLTFLHDDGTDLLAFIQVADPTKVKVGGRNVLKRSKAFGFPSLRWQCGFKTNFLLVVVVRGNWTEILEAATGVIYPSVLKELLASSMLNIEVGVATVATLPMITSSVFATPEHESGVLSDSITGLNLRTIGASERSAAIPSVMAEAVVTSHVVNIPPVLKMGIKVTPPVHASMFHDSDSTETVKADTVGPSYSAKQDLSMGSRELKSETLRQVFVPQWNMLNDSLLDDYDVS